MDLEHHFTVNAPIDTAWATLMDIEGVAECFPGAVLTSADADSFEGTVKVKLGPIALVYKGSGKFTERDDAAHRAVIDAKGKDKRGNGTAGALVTLTMTEAGSATDVSVVTDLNITGKPAQFGRGVMQDVSDALLGQFVECLATKVEGPGESVEAPAAEPAAAPLEATAAADPAAESGAAPIMAAAAPSSPTAPSPAPASPTPTPRAAPTRSKGSTEALDLGAAVGPAILRSYAPQLAIGLGGLLLGWLLGRCGGRRR